MWLWSEERTYCIAALIWHSEPVCTFPPRGIYPLQQLQRDEEREELQVIHLPADNIILKGGKCNSSFRHISIGFCWKALFSFVSVYRHAGCLAESVFIEAGWMTPGNLVRMRKMCATPEAEVVFSRATGDFFHPSSSPLSLSLPPHPFFVTPKPVIGKFRLQLGHGSDPPTSWICTENASPFYQSCILQQEDILVIIGPGVEADLLVHEAQTLRLTPEHECPTRCNYCRLHGENMKGTCRLDFVWSNADLQVCTATSRLIRKSKTKQSRAAIHDCGEKSRRKTKITFSGILNTPTTSVRAASQRKMCKTFRLGCITVIGTGCKGGSHSIPHSLQKCLPASSF